MSSASLSSPTTPNRWVIASAAVLVQLALGSVYAWSVFLKPVTAVFYGTTTSHVTKAQTGTTNLTFSIVLLSLGVTAAFGGYFQIRFGPRVVATVGGILYGLGIILAGLIAPTHNLVLLYLTYGVLAGIGSGLAYIVPLAMLLRWFPDRRGFITGLAVAGFGLGALLIAQTVPPLLSPKSLGVSHTLIYLGSIYLLVIVLATQLFRKAPDNYAPAGWTPPSEQQAARTTRDFTLGEALRDPKWYILWLTLAFNVTAGAAVISVASPLAQQFTGVSAITAAIIVSVISIFNGAGRLVWAWLSDAIGRPFTFFALLIVQFFALLGLAQIGLGSFGLLLIPASIIGLCYGGGFGTMPAFAADFFGAKNSGMIYGAMLTAWSAGGIIGPILISSLEYRLALYVLAVIVIIGAALPLIARVMIRRQSQVVVGVEPVASNR